MKNFLRKRQRGSVLLLAMGSLAALSLFGMVMLNKYGANSLTVRTPASKIELGDLVQGIRQSILDPTLCTKALTGYKYPRVPTGSAVTSTANINNMTAVIGANTVTIAAQGIGTNGVSIAAAPQAQAAFGIQSSLQIIGGPNYINFGLQPSFAPANVKNLYCQQADLHIVAAGQIANAANQNFFGNSLAQQDIPITILTDVNDNIQSCFGGSAATVCTQAGGPPPPPGCLPSGDTGDQEYVQYPTCGGPPAACAAFDPFPGVDSNPNIYVGGFPGSCTWTADSWGTMSAYLLSINISGCCSGQPAVVGPAVITPSGCGTSTQSHWICP